MNQETIEKLLRKAPRLSPPPGLLEQLQNDISLPGARSNRPSYVSSTPWFKRWIPAFSFCGLIVGCLVLIAMQSDSISKLKQENESLARESQNTDPARGQNPQSSPENHELQTLRKENVELQALRAEATRLREQIGGLDQLLAENRRLLGQLTAQHSSSGDGEVENLAAKAESIRCVNNLKNIGLAARIFASDHQDAFPPDFLTIKNELGTPKILHCRSDIGKTEVADWAEFGPGNNSYEMLSPGFKEGGDPHTVFVRCPIHGHICLADGSVQMNPERNGAKIIFKDGKAVLSQAPQPVAGE